MATYAAVVVLQVSFHWIEVVKKSLSAVNVKFGGEETRLKEEDIKAIHAQDLAP